MRHGNQHLLSAAAITVMCGCSSTDRVAPEKVGVQTQPLAAAPALVAQTGPLTPAKVAHAVSTVPPPDVQAANAARLALGDATEVAKLRSVALGVSSVAGVSSPATVHAVAASDHQVAASILSGAMISDHAPVYVIKVTGGPFTAPRHPRGVAAPQGNFLTVTVDAATHRITDVGYVNVEPDLSQIGSPGVDLAGP